MYSNTLKAIPQESDPESIKEMFYEIPQFRNQTKGMRTFIINTYDEVLMSRCLGLRNRGLYLKEVLGKYKGEYDYKNSQPDSDNEDEDEDEVHPTTQVPSSRVLQPVVASQTGSRISTNTNVGASASTNSRVGTNVQTSSSAGSNVFAGSRSRIFTNVGVSPIGNSGPNSMVSVPPFVSTSPKGQKRYRSDLEASDAMETSARVSGSVPVVDLTTTQMFRGTTDPQAGTIGSMVVDHKFNDDTMDILPDVLMLDFIRPLKDAVYSPEMAEKLRGITTESFYYLVEMVKAEYHLVSELSNALSAEQRAQQNSLFNHYRDLLFNCLKDHALLREDIESGVREKVLLEEPNYSSLQDSQKILIGRIFTNLRLVFDKVVELFKNQLSEKICQGILKLVELEARVGFNSFKRVQKEVSKNLQQYHFLYGTKEELDQYIFQKMYKMAVDESLKYSKATNEIKLSFMAKKEAHKIKVDNAFKYVIQKTRFQDL